VVAVSNYLVQYAPFLVLGRFASDDMLGSFGAAQRVVMAVNMLNLVVGSVYFPHFAEAWRQGATAKLRRMYRTTVLIQVLGSLPVLVLILARPTWVLGAFGEGFAAGVPALLVLSVGYWLSMFLGPSEGALLMFGEADSLRNAAFWVLLVELVAVFWLVPRHLDVATAAITAAAYLARRLWARLLVARSLRRLAAAGEASP
jgi:O-antigen/teichoic acid export membrane protein